MTPPLLALVTSKTTYTVGSLSVILFTVSYYITYPPIVRDRCDNILVEAKYKHEYEVSHFGADFPKGRSSKQKSINQQVSHLSNHSNTSEYASGNHIVQFERKWITEGKHEFNIFQNDAIVFLHIQKTGGSDFDRILTRRVVGAECVCRHDRSCQCNRPMRQRSDEGHGTYYHYDYRQVKDRITDEDYGNLEDYEEEGDSEDEDEDEDTWLFTRSSNFGWSCGLHADWTELTSCVPAMLNNKQTLNPHRRFFYVTVLRDPLTRFLSEWRHVQRGATWKRSNHMCNSQPHEIRSCYEGEEWSGVSLDEFISCRWNLAFNRQTRMLADLSLVNCYEFITYQYNTTNLNSLSSPDRERLKVLEHKMLESAKSNLKRLAFFAILGRSSESHSLISASLGLHFHEGAFGTRTPKSEKVQLDDGVKKRILMLNYLDSELFNFATEIFNERLKLLETS